MGLSATFHNTFLNENKYLRKLPLVDFTSMLYPEADLSDACIICAQHLVSTTYTLFTTLLNLGLRPENLSAIGKCYSTDPEAFQEMKKLGIDVCPSSLSFNSHKPFDLDYPNNVKNFFESRIDRAKKKNFRKIIILDDGGELIKASQNQINPGDPVIGIEQTSSGFHKLKEQKIPFPIINVARSPAKLNYESPIIARLVLETLVSHIKNLPLKPKTVLIIGNGPIGSQIREALKNNYQISIYDQNILKSTIPHEDFKKSLKKFDLIIGCTGTPVLELEDYKLLKQNVILVSASSSDREFDAVSLRKQIPPVADCHKNLSISNTFLINCGFPINFSSQYRAIDSDDLQLTRSLLLAAILQADSHSEKSKKGFIPLDIENQREIIQKYFSMFIKNKKPEKLVV